MSEDETHDAIVDLISEIKLITGATVYEGDMLRMQLEMIKRFILSGYSMLTKEEMVEAFYMNLQGMFDEVYLHYNKELNAEYIGSVLRAYLRWKAAQLRDNNTVIRAALQPPVKPVVHEVDYEFWRDMVQQDLDFINGKADITLWHRRKYTTMRKFGMMPFKGITSWFYFLKKAIVSGNYDLRIPKNANIRAYRFVTVNQVFLLFNHPEEYHHCVEEAKKMAYWYVLVACKECGINKIWEDLSWNGND